MEDDGAFTIDDFNLMDQLLDDGFWLETTNGSDFCPTASTDLNCSSHHFPTSEANLPSFITNQEESLSKETEKSNFLDSNHPPSSHHPQMGDDFFSSQGQNHEPAFLVQDTQVNRRLWVGPNKNRTPIPSSSSTTTISVKKRLLQAINYLKDSIRDEDVLIQIWIPVKRGDRQVLTTKNQPYSLNPNCCKNLADYRDISRSYQFAVDEDSKEFVGLPGRVFLKKLPEWTPDVRFFKREEYPRVNHAQQFDVRGSLALPVFQLGSGNCLGVVEIVTTSQKINYRPELENVCKALQAVDLKSSGILSPPNTEDRNEAYQAALTEIRKVLKCACDMHKLPLAQTWMPCIQQGKGGHRHSDENYARCISTIDYACYVSDSQVSGFHEACSEHHLLKGEGIAGKAFLTNKPCFAKDMTAFRKTEYPLAHHARVFNLCAAVAIRLRSMYTGKDDFVLEFFLPQNCKDDQDQRLMLDSLSSVIQQICQSLRVVTDQELAQETSAGTLDDEMYPRLVTNPSKEPSDMMETHQNKGKGVVVSLGHQHEEGEGEFKEVHSQFQLQDSGLGGSAANSTGNIFLAGGIPSFGAKTSSEKRRTKTEKTISLQVLRQYFAGSLKDAAKSIGVCPTTLKRICRQHGITRWPSRKIKKVGHSLRKLQLVMDSVQGTEGGSMKLTSFYNNFPELVSPKVPATSGHLMTSGHHLQQVNTQPPEQGTTLLYPVTTASKSSSSSASLSSSSSCCHSTATGLKKISSFPFNGSSSEDAVLSAEQIGGKVKRARSNAELHDLGQEETKLLVRSYSQNICNAESHGLGQGERKLLVRSQSHKISCSAVPKKKNSSPQEVHNVATFFRLKVSFGEEKIRLSLKPHWDFKKLQQEVLRRFNMDNDNKVDLKYLDDDAEWVLLTCDADLEECTDIHRSSKSRTIRLSLNQPSHHPSIGNSFGSK